MPKKNLLKINKEDENLIISCFKSFGEIKPKSDGKYNYNLKKYRELKSILFKCGITDCNDSFYLLIMTINHIWKKASLTHTYKKKILTDENSQELINLGRMILEEREKKHRIQQIIFKLNKSNGLKNGISLPDVKFSHPDTILRFNQMLNNFLDKHKYLLDLFDLLPGLKKKLKSINLTQIQGMIAKSTLDFISKKTIITNSNQKYLIIGYLLQSAGIIENEKTFTVKILPTSTSYKSGPKQKRTSYEKFLIQNIKKITK